MTMMTPPPLRCALLLVLLCCLSSVAAVETIDADNSQNLRGVEDTAAIVDDASESWFEATRRSLTWKNLDARWKSTKISDECKKRLGIHKPDDYIDPNEADVEIVDTVAEEVVEEEVIEAEEVVEEDEKAEAKEAQAEAAAEDGVSRSAPGTIPGGNRRKFVSYHSSAWEQGWLAGIHKLVESKSICETLLQGDQKQAVHAFLNMICTAKAGNYCYYHDHNHFMWYNTQNTDRFQVYLDKVPMAIEGVTAPEIQPVQVDPARYDSIASKFTFLDETTGEEYVEYIEPLVAQLRFPLAECLPKRHMPLLADFASFVLPPPNFDRVDGRTLLFDLGSKDWSRMEYIVEEWANHGTDFKYMISYSTSGNEMTDDFLKTIPDKHKEKIFRHYLPLADHEVDDPATEGLFIPAKMQEMAADDDYILLKLDKGDASMKLKYVDYILDNPGIHVDELIWEINAAGNYVMESWFDMNLEFSEISSLTLPDAYDKLLKLRQQGVRAHSWI